VKEHTALDCAMLWADPRVAHVMIDKYEKQGLLGANDDKKGGGKGKKDKKPKEKKPLEGPNGEGADDDTCWEVKQTGLCPRYPCKWQPCVDLPDTDGIFKGAKKRGGLKKKF